MTVLGIETSCDETAAAVVGPGLRVVSNVVASQVRKHAAYGGVIPELAAREHLTALDTVLHRALNEADKTLSEVDAIAVTHRPGLVPALIVGVCYAKGLAAVLGVPLTGVNHILAHVYGAFLEEPSRLSSPDSFPLVALVVSGGHTILLAVERDGATEILGQTLDDAAGEAFDKAAKLLDLGYPGGPVIDRLAREGNPAAYRFPRALTGGAGRPVRPEQRFCFSFSGVKTALLYEIRERTPADADLRDLAASYQQAVVDVLVRKTRDAIRSRKARTVAISGGVACNSALRTAVSAMADEEGCHAAIAPFRYCTDNAAMIAALGQAQLTKADADRWNLEVLARMPQHLVSLPLPAARSEGREP